MPGWKLANLATQACLTEFGVAIVFTPAGGAPESRTVSGRPLRAVFDDAQVQILQDGEEPTNTTRPVVDLRNSDTTRPARKGDAVQVAGVAYTIAEVVPTGNGTCQAYLTR